MRTVKHFTIRTSREKKSSFIEHFDSLVLKCHTFKCVLYFYAENRIQNCCEQNFVIEFQFEFAVSSFRAIHDREQKEECNEFNGFGRLL